MCGRARLSSDVSEIKLVFSVPPERPALNFAASWNVAPTDPLPVVRFDTRDGQRSLDVMRWGLIPYWAKDIKIGFSTINARAEEIDTKPAFREAFRQRRCLVPLDNFYEWAKTPTGKQPYAIGLANGGLMAMAGVLKPELWPIWLGEEPADAAHLKALLAPYPSEDMICWPVSARVGNVKNNDPSLVRHPVCQINASPRPVPAVWRAPASTFR
jgi:putative SOS response-associated peptidase YedK